MSKEYDGWILKNTQGSFALYFLAYTRKRVIERIGKARWESWRVQGCKIVKVKFTEVK